MPKFLVAGVQHENSKVHDLQNFQIVGSLYVKIPLARRTKCDVQGLFTNGEKKADQSKIFLQIVHVTLAQIIDVASHI
jgi:hypothetical protein